MTAVAQHNDTNEEQQYHLFEDRTITGRTDLAAIQERQQEQNRQRSTHHQHTQQLALERTQDGVPWRQVPYRGNMRRRLQVICRHVVIDFDKITTHLRVEEDHIAVNGQEDTNAECILDGVIWMEVDLLIITMHINTFRIVGVNDMQCMYMATNNCHNSSGNR